MSQVMWFGTKGHERWVKAPATSADFSRVRYANQLAFLNGGAAMQGSRTSHAEYNMAWNIASRATLRPIQDFQAHVYDNDPLARRMVADNLIYFLDPMEMSMNLAPIFWGNPILSATDAPSLIKGHRPTPVATSKNTLGYPTYSAKYTIPSSAKYRTFYIPCPPKHKLWFGAHGSGKGVVTVKPEGGSLASLAWISPSSGVRVNASFTDGCTVSLGGSAGNTLTLTALIIQCLPANQSPEGGEYISGRGHTGCAFDNEPKVTAYSNVNERAEVGMTAKLVEVGAWLPLS